MAGMTHEQRVQAQRESEEQKRNLRRCPACYAVAPLLYGPCNLARCPKVFLNIEPPTDGAQARGAVQAHGGN
jgi:hypothetical protein